MRTMAFSWTATGQDPFRPTRDGDRLYGLGSADAKLDFLCKLAAIAEVDATRLRYPLRLVGTFAEEIGLRGARHLVESGETRGFRYALVGEPSELACVRAHKGYAVYEARIPLPELGQQQCPNSGSHNARTQAAPSPEPGQPHTKPRSPLRTDKPRTAQPFFLGSRGVIPIEWPG